MSQNIFVIGASGFVGSTLARHFVAQGQEVSGLARSSHAESALRAVGVQPVHGDLDTDLAPVLAAACSANVIVYAAQVAFEREPAVIRRLCDALAGSAKTLIFLSGSGVFMQRTGGAWSPDSFAEDDSFVPEPLALLRVEAEEIVRAAARRELRSMVIRPPLIWGPGDNGPVAQVYRSVALTGAACYIGSGLAAYSNVHGDDLARLFSLAIERGQPGALYHAAAGEIAYGWIAEAVARDLGVKTRSLSMDEAVKVFGPFGALIHSACSRSRDPRTRGELGWKPTRLDLLSEIGEPRLRALAIS
ncbi:MULTISPECIES: NAD-dependent epimerase/dehydratase family protein [Burkholderia]|mgnify:CR=1 FL=1|uniref:NAD-dependent epimerase/dehydratase family protein n=5 Tax=Burkholderia cepacia complex TaxID=87882 RepID=A0A2S5DN53_9BURK|nr:MULTISPECIES: NAD-dependent epimerase/dehydratase family protein [Burkholderia]EKS9800471.1 NAD-dependent epimerase/dehydratase family protein [Burkholderia cepacia]EKS9808104.1 NAD-dependent epimerase/dehydratase family protein [Burkholderia cepacia]EKS9815674.1 NAD-dependent epimerase/dehydratase family protein [Burkholderia cepacia]EKS9823477.1 NAD-dependent epimerase/dehydratase family protein [Burkholderia cepacia]EKS9831100.1 NAD-dependent epimerase/dehydratase family protein [Burkhol